MISNQCSGNFSLTRCDGIRDSDAAGSTSKPSKKIRGDFIMWLIWVPHVQVDGE
jgi:hypothetical protein